MSRRRTRRFRRGEQLEMRYCLSTIVFVDHPTDTSGGLQDIETADFDGDGDLDVLARLEQHNREEGVFGKMVWYENTDGLGTFEERTIGDVDSAILSIAPADIDADGDVDVFIGKGDFWGWGGIYWFENIDGRGSFGEERFLPLDDCQFISNGRHRCSLIASIRTADMDGDGDADVVSSGPHGNGRDISIAWHENTDGKGLFGEQHALRASGVVLSVFPTDLDGDGDHDVLSAGDTTIAWYENLNGTGSFGPRLVISSETDRAAAVYAADLDGDGDQDVLSAARGDNKIVWHENVDGQGSFGEQRVITKEAHYSDGRFGDGADTVHVADVDGDGDMDVLSGSHPGTVAWYENLDGAGSFAGQQVISNRLPLRFESVHFADVDGDGDLDVLSATYWHENRLLGDSNDDGIFESGDLVAVFQAGKYEDNTPNNATFDEGDWNQDGDFNSSDLVLVFQNGHYVSEGGRFE